MYPKLQERGFVPVVPWDQLKELLKPKELERFQDWMNGQTSMVGGVFPWDLERFLNNLPVID